MATIINSLTEELRENGIVGSVIWRPERFYAKDGDEYISIDTVSDGTVDEVKKAIQSEGNIQKELVRSAAKNQLDALKDLEDSYFDVKESLLQTYTRLYNYFVRQKLTALATIIATAIVNLNNMQ